MMRALDIVLDNPLLVKHLRSRLRPQHVVPSVVVVMVLSVVILWGGYALRGLTNGVAMACVLGLQVLILVFSGSNQIGSSVLKARESGIMDFHRVSPQPPVWLALGFFLGAPAREYLLVAVTLPFAAIAAMAGPTGLEGWLRLTIVLLVGAWVVQALTLMTSLSSRNPKATGSSVGGLILLAIFLGGPIVNGLWYASRFAGDEALVLHFYGVRLPWMVFMLMYLFPMLAFFLVAAVRKMRSERAHSYSKPQAVGSLAVFAVLLLGAFWDIRNVNYLVLALLYALVAAAVVLTLTITPEASEYVRGLHRAHREGRRRPSPWSDAGSNRLALLVMCALVLAATTVAWEAIEGRPIPNRSIYSQSIALGVLTVAYFGLALQYFQLRFGKRGDVFLRLFLFLVWVVPLLVGGILAASRLPEATWQSVLAISPLAGLALSTGLEQQVTADVVRLAALLPAVTFAFLFHHLLVTTQRRLDLALKPDIKPELQFDPLRV